MKEHSCKVIRKQGHEFAPLRTYRALMATVSSLCNSFVGLKGHRLSEHVGTRLAFAPSKSMGRWANAPGQ